MIDLLLPSSVTAVETFTDVAGEPAFPGEQDVIAKAVPGRRAEFITARRCAREALSHLGYPPVALRPGPRREPLWPDGVAGSITHCTGYRAAAVTRTSELASLGIDAEPHGPLPPGVGDSVTVAGERDMLDRLACTDPTIHWDRLLFSAKESIYKAWYPLTHRWLGFEDAHLSVDPATRTFTARLLVDGTRLDGGPVLTEVNGRYLVGGGLVLTAVTVAHPA